MTEWHDRLAETQQRLEQHMSAIRDWFLEERYRTHAPAYFGRFLRQVQPVHIGRLADALRERLAEGELAEVLLADLILTGSLPTQPSLRRSGSYWRCRQRWTAGMSNGPSGERLSYGKPVIQRWR
jgi:hypothetical protein